MGLPRFLVENFFDGTQFGSASVTANEEAGGHEAFRVGTRRRTSLNFWTPTTANQDAWVEVKLSDPRAADLLVIDREHNLDGEEVKLQVSDDNFSNTETIFTETIPSVSTTSSDLSEGARMKDGAWARSFDPRIATYWRLLVSAMGSGNKPQIGGLYLGISWQPGFHLERPFGWGDREIRFTETQSPNVWAGSSRVSQRVARTYRVRLGGFSAYESARYHTEGRYWRGVPMWVFADREMGERGYLSKAPPGQHGWEQARGWGFMQTDLQTAEHQPAQV